MRRRSLLKAIAAGSMTAATPLACLLARNAMAQNGNSPVRTIFLFHPNGCVPDLFFPRAGSSALPAMSAPLGSVYDNLVFLDGIGYAGGANTHEGGSYKCLTGRKEFSDRDSSIDVLMGKEDFANGVVSVPSIQMGVATHWGNDDNKRVSHDGGTSLDANCDPRILYPRLFTTGGGGSTDGGSGTPYAKMLSVAKEDLKRLENALGSVERERMQQHTDALAVLEARFGSAGGGDSGAMDAVCGVPSSVEAGIDGFGPVTSDDTKAEMSRTGILNDVSEIQQRLAVAALSCGLTRTMAFSYGVSVSPVVVPGTSTNDHDLSHQDGAAHTTSKVWWMGEIAKFIQMLDATPDGNGSLLDNTIVVTVSDLGHGNYHDHYRVPMFLASGKSNNMGLVTGRSLDFRPFGTSKQIGDGAMHPTINHTDVLDTIRQVAGYTSFEMPNKEGDIMAAWRGGDAPR